MLWKNAEQIVTELIIEKLRAEQPAEPCLYSILDTASGSALKQTPPH